MLLLTFTITSLKFSDGQEYIKNNLIEDVPQFMKNQIEVNKTILEVEQLIAKNSDLPRLTRGEILSLLQNITLEDEMKAKKPRPQPQQQHSSVRSKPNRPKQNVMVVLPEGTISTTKPPPVFFAPTPSFVTLDQIESSSQFENLVTLQKSPNKNEFKRQQPSDGIASSTTTEDTEAGEDSTEAETTTASASEGNVRDVEEVSPAPQDSVKAEDSSPSLSDLAESFGGGETASEEPAAEALPTPRPNGLYFYVDWNTFLNVGSEDTKNRVNLRFAPKVGNPRLFLPVSVP